MVVVSRFTGVAMVNADTTPVVNINAAATITFFTICVLLGVVVCLLVCGLLLGIN